MRFSIKTSLLIVSLSLFSTFSISQNLNDSLLIHYTFDGNAQDQSGNGYDGIVNATLTQDQFGNPNSAYSFNGIDEFIDLPNVADLKPDLPISYSVWVKFNSLPSTGNVMFTNNFAQDNHSGVWMQGASNGAITIAFGSALGGTSSNNIRRKRGSTIVQTGVWYHVAGVVRGPTDMDIYIDCVDDGGTYHGQSASTVGYTADAGSIGRKDVANASPYYFDGVLDEFRYWNRAITLNDIEKICERNASVNENSMSYNLQVYPNPAEETINFTGDVDQIDSFQIIDLNGRVVLTSSKLSSIDVSAISEGMYHVHISLKDGSLVSKKLIIK